MKPNSYQNIILKSLITTLKWQTQKLVNNWPQIGLWKSLLPESLSTIFAKSFAAASLQSTLKRLFQKLYKIFLIKLKCKATAKKMQGICSVVCHMKSSEIILKSEIIPKNKNTH